MKWIVRARGHPNIRGTHQTTFMITRDLDVGPRGDCIIGVKAEMGASDLPEELKALLRSGRGVLIRITAGGLEETVRARGHPELGLDHPNDLVVRKSRFLCRRTVAIEADKAAGDLSRRLVHLLRNPNVTVEIEFRPLP